MATVPRTQVMRRPVDQAIPERGFTEPSRNIDWILIAAMAALAVIGVFTVYSATHLRMIDIGLDPFSYTTRQVGFVIAAAAAMAIIMWLGHELARRRSAFLYAGLLFALIFVLTSGAVTGGARLAFDFGLFSLQPAEFGKPILLLMLAGYLSDEHDEGVDWHHFVVSLVVLGAPIGLILFQPDLGTASVIVAGSVGVLFVANARSRYLLLIGTLAVSTVFAAITAFSPLRYQLRRVDAWLNQNSTRSDLQEIVLQVRFAKRAVSTGGVFGKGYLEGPLTNGKYIPVQFTDFPFSAIGEQFGMVGGFVVLALFAVVLVRLWRIAQSARDRFSRLFVAGAFTMVLWQVFQNIGMTLGLVPVSGLPLPFISYGGSNLLSLGVLMGLVQSVHMRRYQ